MRVVIAGQKWLATEILAACIARGYDILLAVTNPAGSFAKAAAEQGVAVSAQIADIPPCDVIAAAHLHQYLPAPIRARAKSGVIAYHPSLLPRHRGRDAVRWAIHMREPITGGTVYRMDDGADTGAVLAQDWCHIRPEDTAATLWQRELAPMGVRLMMGVLAEIERGGDVAGFPQDERLATFEPGFPTAALADI